MAVSRVPTGWRPSAAASSTHRLVVFVFALAMTGVLLIMGLPWLIAAAVTAAVMTAGGELGLRLTMPSPAPTVRVVVVVIICIVITLLIGQGYSPVSASVMTIAAALAATEVARRFAGATYRLPRLVFA
ncbi:hypothetical protein GBF35_00260 [Nonomuraea phyllanthi]|uniref:hypothetical protein n=1 Tax=Nonomuraea phyllanthi TaxID=2219224 RepID=UPI00129314A4|nr:hypothetical protein [Nonomuraea phyllanthi]QFY05324.1 hypothetical protein GBF35_00260 [Nonomuraea phyllanthi]